MFLNKLNIGANHFSSSHPLSHLQTVYQHYQQAVLSFLYNAIEITEVERSNIYILI